MENLRDILARILAHDEVEADDATIAECLQNEKDLKVYGRDKHRWYTLFKRVVRIGDIFVEFQDYEYHSEESPFDSEQSTEMVINSMIQVFPKEVTIIDYVQ